jgi:putative phosphoribosyl transferase
MWRKRSEHHPPFIDRADAGRQLADALAPLVADVPRERLIALGLARGGVVLAAEVSTILGIAMDALVVRKIGAPMQPELAIGAVGPGDNRLLNQPLIASLGLDRNTVDAIGDATSAERDRLDRELRGGRPFPAIADRTVILVDDGLATGASMRAAWGYVARETGAVIVAVPVAPPDAVNDLERLGAQVVALLVVRNFGAVGSFYTDFGEVHSDTVRAILDAEASGPPETRESR